ncbi:hypothetical protein HYX19_05020 [Candidatus Woesearchaeota archaeon]|nr:hypothetical protein [Candidatus Woesearchaeota archaeon]
MISDLSVVVGVDSKYDDEESEEREKLADKIEEKGYNVERTSVAWPRDHYVFIGGNYLIRKEIGSCGEGGYFHASRNFVLVSERLNLKENKPDLKKTFSAVEKYYPDKRIHIIPTGYDHERIIPFVKDPNFEDHIDLTCLLIHSKKLLIVDQSFYDGLSFEFVKRIFTNIAESEDLSLEFYKPSNRKLSFEYYPLNCLVLPYRDSEIVFVNKRAHSLIKLLKKYNLEVVSITMNKAPELGGSIRCCTNIKDNTKTLDDLLDYDNDGY